MISSINKDKMNVSKATSTLIGLILQMPPKEIIETLHFVENKLKNTQNGTMTESLTEVVFAVDKRLCKGIGRGIKPNGLFILTAESFCPGESITLSFENKVEGRQIKATGRIVNVTEDGIGVAFDSNTEKMEH